MGTVTPTSMPTSGPVCGCGALSRLWTRMMSGDRERHDAMVLEGARALAAEVDALVLAQASMARLAPAIAEAVGKPVLASPRMGVENAVQVLNGQPA
jgi:hypothetical protein